MLTNGHKRTQLLCFWLSKKIDSKRVPVDKVTWICVSNAAMWWSDEYGSLLLDKSKDVYYINMCYFLDCTSLDYSKIFSRLKLSQKKTHTFRHMETACTAMTNQDVRQRSSISKILIMIEIIFISLVFPNN